MFLASWPSHQRIHVQVMTFHVSQLTMSVVSTIFYQEGKGTPVFLKYQF